MSKAAKGPAWISVRAASTRLGLPIYTVRRMVQAGVLDSFHAPHTRPLVNAADVERAARQYRRPATADA